MAALKLKALARFAGIGCMNKIVFLRWRSADWRRRRGRLSAFDVLLLTHLDSKLEIAIGLIC